MHPDLIKRINVPGEIRQETESWMCKCGNNNNECVVFWLSNQTDNTEISIVEAWHPIHHATAVGYEVTEDEIQRLHEYLYRQRKAVIVQLHTHPGSAFHSSTDDQWPMIHSFGFLSLVVPFFCSNGLNRLTDCFIARYLGNAQWKKIEATETKELFHFE